jgi:transcriptional regulator with XRE-family HTH domain
MREIDRPSVGRRIREIRRQSGLRQWELARLLGTTQSAIHKYEHGIVPEPRRLMELARVGQTSIEWILTGRHGERGPEGRELPPIEVLETASVLARLEGPERPYVEEALRVLREAAAALHLGSDSPVDPRVVRAELAEHGSDTLRVLESAWRVQRAVLRRIVREAQGRLDAASTDEEE